jgi:hypothetical protein
MFQIFNIRQSFRGSGDSENISENSKISGDSETFSEDSEDFRVFTIPRVKSEWLLLLFSPHALSLSL